MNAASTHTRLQKNNTSAGEYEVNNGEIDRGDSVGKMISYNGAASTPETWWGSEQARMINGTDSALYKPFITKDDVLEVFAPDLCRYQMYSEASYCTLRCLDRSSSSMIVTSPTACSPRIASSSQRTILTTHEKKMQASVMTTASASTSNSPTAAACPAACSTYHGAREVSALTRACHRMATTIAGEPPVIISMPNFAFAPDYVVNSIGGLPAPDLQQDLAQVDIEPRLGVVIEAKRRFQVNV